MAIQVQIEGHGTAEFPDGTDPAVIERTVKQQVASKPDKGYLEVTAGPNRNREPLSAAEWLDKSDRKWTANDLKDVIKETTVPEWGRNNPNLYGAYGAAKAIGRTGIETAGQIGGGILGGAAGLASPIPGGAAMGGLAGAGAGYAAAKQLADFALGDNEYKAPTMGDVGKDFLLGAATEGLGAAIPKIPGALKSIKDFAQGVTPALTESAIRDRAAQTIFSKAGKSPIYDANAIEAAGVTQEIPGFRASLAESRNDPGLIKLQRGYERGDTPAAHALLEKNAANRQSLDSYLGANFGEDGVEPALDSLAKQKTGVESEVKWAAARAGKAREALNPVDPQTAGQGLHKAVSDAMEPVLRKERELWAQVPNYPIPADSTQTAFREVMSTPSTAEDVVRKLYGVYEKTPKTVQGLQTIEREINSAIETGTQTEKHFLRQIKKAVNDDFEAMGTAAEKGDVAVYDGKIVHPSKLKAEQDNLSQRIAEAQSAAETTPDIAAVRDALKNAGEPPNFWMKQVNETDGQYNNRLITRYHQKIGVDIPMLGAEPPPSVLDMQSRMGQIDDILANAKPADNVAKAYRAAKDYSRDVKFARFDKGAIKEILKPGSAANGRTVADSQIIGRFFSGTKALDEADQLIKAIGSKEEAARIMEGHIADDLMRSAQNPATGELDPKRLAAWLRKRGDVLDKYGLREQYDTINAAHATLDAAKEAEAQFAHSIAAKMLNADPKRAIAAAMEGNAGMHGGGVSAKNTGAIMQNLMQQLHGDAQAIEGLRAGFKDFLIDVAETTRKSIAGDNLISPAAVQKALAKYEPAMDALYKGAPDQLKALKNVSKAVEIQSRSASSPLGGGSDTAENAMVNLLRLIDHVPVAGQVLGLTRKGLGLINGMTQKQIDEMVVNLLYDPEFAKTFSMAAKNQSPKVVERQMAKHLAKIATSAAVYGAKNTWDNDPLGLRGGNE